MSHSHWPIFDLRIRTPRLELRAPTDEDISALCDVVIEHGVHDPAFMPFSTPWTDLPSPRREWQSQKWHWSCRANWSPTDWTLPLAVVVDGAVIGVQDIRANNFAQLRIATTGSWIGRTFQGKGIGKEMRAAVLHFGFEGLGARLMRSEFFQDNGPSSGVTRALGYQPNGSDWHIRRGKPDPTMRYELDKATWEASRRSDIEIENLAECLDFFVGDPEDFAQPR